MTGLLSLRCQSTLNLISLTNFYCSVSFSLNTFGRTTLTNRTDNLIKTDMKMAAHYRRYFQLFFNFGNGYSKSQLNSFCSKVCREKILFNSTKSVLIVECRLSSPLGSTITMTIGRERIGFVSVIYDN